MKWIICVFILSFKVFAGEVICQKTIESNESYTHCLNQYDFYPRPLHIYIPNNVSDMNDKHLFVHFHGHNLTGFDHFFRTQTPGDGYGDYGFFLQDSGVNGVLIIPESLGNCETYDQFFAVEKNAQNFFLQIKKITNIQNSLHLSGHSGAYRVLNKLTGYIVDKKITSVTKLDSLGLFDATYGQVPNIERWLTNNLRENREFYFLSSFVSGDKATAEPIARALMKKYQDKNIEMVPVLSNKRETLLQQHFFILKRAGLKSFFERSSLFDAKI